MIKIRLKQPLLVETTHHNEGDVVLMSDVKGQQFIKGGFADKVEEGEVVNQGFNPLADAITPEPPGGANASPADSLVPEVNDNPGLQALQTAARSGGPRRAAKVIGKAD